MKELKPIRYEDHALSPAPKLTLGILEERLTLLRGMDAKAFREHLAETNLCKKGDFWSYPRWDNRHPGMADCDMQVDSYRKDCIEFLQHKAWRMTPSEDLSVEGLKFRVEEKVDEDIPYDSKNPLNLTERLEKHYLHVHRYDVSEALTEIVNDCNEQITILNRKYPPATVAKLVDPERWELAKQEHLAFELEEEQVIIIRARYFHRHVLEQFIDGTLDDC